MDNKAANYNEKAKKDDGSCYYGISFNVPENYTFTDAKGNNTVSFNGQKQRLEMLTEMVTYMKTANKAGIAVSADQLKKMYANASYTWKDAPGLSMTGSSKQLKSKTAGGDAAIQKMFENYIDSLAEISSSTSAGKENGTENKGGVWPNDGVKGPYLISGKGIEYTQLIEKGLMCAVFMHQMTVNYLGGISEDDNTMASNESEGKYYTEMEHHWDEAFGYFTSVINYPVSGTDRFWGKYAKSRESELNSATKLKEAFYIGRAAIGVKNYEVRDQQVKIIQDEIEKVCAGTAIHYLNGAKSNIGNSTARNHQLSEAYAFISGLKYGYNAINGVNITNARIDAALAAIGEDFNKVTASGLQSAIDILAADLGLEAVKASL